MRSLAVLIATAVLALVAVAFPLALAYWDAPTAPKPLVVGEPDLVYKQGTMTMRLTQRLCRHDGMASALEEDGIPPARVYVMEQEGRQQVRGCWVVSGWDDEVLVEDLNSEARFMPLSWFKPDLGV